MTNRVLLDVNGVRISKPGVDVLSADLNSSDFLAEYTHTNRVLFGALAIPTSFNASSTFNFGRSFSSTPLIFANYDPNLITGSYVYTGPYGIIGQNTRFYHSIITFTVSGGTQTRTIYSEFTFTSSSVTVTLRGTNGANIGNRVNGYHNLILTGYAL